MAIARNIVLIVLSAALMLTVACENTTPTPEEHQAVETAVRGYLFALAQAYSTLDVSVLEGHASPNEIAAVKKLLTDLLQKTGDRIDADLVGFEIQSMSMFRDINATVRLVEVWDVTRYGAATGVEKGHTENSIQNTLLQMRLVDGSWICVGRSILSQETPIPTEEPPIPTVVPPVDEGAG